jgi:hypothetical protein
MIGGPLALADIGAVIGDVFAGIAATAALIAIVYAKRGAEAARDAVREAHELRIEEDYREFARSLWKVRQAALSARDKPDYESLARLRDAQTELQSRMVLPSRVQMGGPDDLQAYDEVTQMLETVLNHASEPQEVVIMASLIARRVQTNWRQVA